MMQAGRWEAGSAFPLALPAGRGWVDAPDPLRLFGSGRQAFAALLEWGRRERGWVAVHLPTYYCPEVVADIAGILPVRRYDAGPVGEVAPPLAGPRDVVVAVSYFGAPPAFAPPTAADWVIDATHDPFAPWLRDSRADYVFASLRKTLPLPDGGALWSYRGHALPPTLSPTEPHMATVGKILSAMCLKAAYLDGAALDKEHYLDLYAEGEDGLRSRALSGISHFSRDALGILAVEELYRRRINNSAALASALNPLQGVVTRGYSFGVVLEFESYEQRESVRRALIGRNVYPAVLWSLPPDAGPRHHVDFSRRMLFLHADFRWDERDMRRVASLVREVHEEPTPTGRRHIVKE